MPINRLVCVGYGFADEHVNAVIEAALARTDFTALIFTKELSTASWGALERQNKRYHSNRNKMFSEGPDGSRSSRPLEL